MFSSDIGHWDVPDMAGILVEAWELVEDGLIDEADFREFVFANPVRFYHSIWFRMKLVMLVLAGLNASFFHSGIWQRVGQWDRDVITPRRARAAGAASLVLWAAIVVAGRMIAYNWFDCDMPPPSIIVQLAGCTPDRR